jgi:hypothetical protein
MRINTRKEIKKMKRVRTLSVNDNGTKTQIIIKITERANYNQAEIEKDFETMVDEAYQILAQRYHVFAIKISA